jgi:acetyl-CoA acyltransferase
MAAIVSAGFSRFGKRKEGIMDLAAESALPVSRKYRGSIDFVLVSNCYSGEFNDMSGLNNLVTTYLSLDTVPSIRIDNTSGSGGAALFSAVSLVESGMARAVLVVGIEKMSGKPTKDVTKIISSLLGEREKAAGPSLPSLAGLLTKLYMREFGATRESIAQVAVKNHINGAMNPNAHIQKVLTLEQVLQSAVIIDPLRLFEISPISDGSTSLLVVPDDQAESYTEKPVYVKGIGMSSECAHLTDRKTFTDIPSVRRAGEIAKRQSGVERPDFAELHDMATILEIVQSESLGFFARGEGWKAARDGVTEIGGELPINTSGGLNSKGHPIGATGVAQAAEVFLQLRNEAGQRQVKNPVNGMAMNMSGFGNSASAVIMGVSK